MLKNKNGYLKSDKTSKVEILNDQFQSVSPEKIHCTFSIPDKGSNPHQSMINITINCYGIYKLLKNLKSNKAKRPDSIPAFILKELAHIRTLMFQWSLHTGNVPEEWRKAWNANHIYEGR